MTNIGKPERETQNRVIALFRDELGYGFLGNWSDRPANSNVEEALVGVHLKKKGYS
jgi:type I restriction enzyme R subunit